MRSLLSEFDESRATPGSGWLGRYSSRSRNHRRPELTLRSRWLGTLPANLCRSPLFTVAICEALATESRGRPVNRFDSRVLPGAAASASLLVSTQTKTVANLLALTS